jgi:hypothetical protein
MLEPLADLTVQRTITEPLVIDDKKEDEEEEKRVLVFKLLNYYIFTPGIDFSELIETYVRY